MSSRHPGRWPLPSFLLTAPWWSLVLCLFSSADFFSGQCFFAFLGQVPAESPCSGFLGTQTGARGRLSYSREGEGHLDARDYISQLPLQLGQVMCLSFLLLLNKLLQTSWLKAITVFSYSSGGQKCDMDFTGLTSRCQQGYVLCGGFRGQSIFSSLPVSRGGLHSPGSWLPSSIFKAIIFLTFSLL